MAAKKKRKLSKLKCEECKKTNYYFHKSRKTEGKISLKKYCRWCKKHTLHREVK